MDHDLNRDKMSDLMALEYQSSCLSVYGNSGQSPHSTLQSLTSKSCSAVEANVSDATTIAPAQLNGSSTPPIPQRRPRPTTIYQNLPRSDDFEPKPDNVENDVLSQDHRSRRNSCPGAANQRKTVVSKSVPKPLSRAKVYRWDGQKRTVSDWDGLRRVCTNSVVRSTLLMTSRILNFGSKMGIAMFTCMEMEYHAEDHLS